MTSAFMKYYYGTALAACLLIVGEMAVLKYRELVLPPALMCLVLAALAGLLLGDWVVQLCIERRQIE